MCIIVVSSETLIRYTYIFNKGFETRTFTEQINRRRTTIIQIWYVQSIFELFKKYSISDYHQQHWSHIDITISFSVTID